MQYYKHDAEPNTIMEHHSKT